MKIFIWDYIGELTGNYHSGGGLVVIAETEERARELAKEREVTFDGETCVSYTVDATEEEVYVFPDAGCC